MFTQKCGPKSQNFRFFGQKIPFFEKFKICGSLQTGQKHAFRTTFEPVVPPENLKKKNWK